MNKLINSLVLTCLIGLVGCDVIPSQTRIDGSGNVTTETRTAVGFDQINAEGLVTVIYKKSNVVSVKITAQENLLPYLETNIEGAVLTIKSKEGYNIQPTNGTSIVVRVSSPNVGGLSLIGSGLLSADTLVGDAMMSQLDGSGTIAVGFAKGAKLTANLLGSGVCEIGGHLTTLDCNLDGSGIYRLYGKSGSLNVIINSSGVVEGLEHFSQKSMVNINGSGVCKVSVSSLLNVNIKGSGSVMYKGTAQVSKIIDGSGTVQNLN